MEAISQAPQPKNTTKLRSFLGLVNCYRKVYPAVSIYYTAIESITVQEESLEMDYQVSYAFTTLKTKWKFMNVLVHYDVNLP